MAIRVKVKEALDERHMTQKELSERSGVPQATLSDLVRDNRTGINKDHLYAIAHTLNITDIRELIDLTIGEKEGKNNE